MILVLSLLPICSCHKVPVITDSSYEPPHEVEPPDGEVDGEPGDFDRILEALQDGWLSVYEGESSSAVSSREALDRYVSGYMSAISDDGAFPEVDYTDRSQTGWKPLAHLNYVGQMASAYVLRESIHYGQPELYTAICNALSYWYKVWPTSTNWWNNQIAVPRDLAKPLILMRSGQNTIPESIESPLLERWARTGGDPAERTGANKSDIALHWLYRGCLQSDEDVVSYAVEQAFEPLEFSSVGTEGIQYDYSYFQHNAQLYVGGYADVMLNAVIKVAGYVKDTEFITLMTQERKDLLCEFVTGTMMDCIRGSYMYFNVMGRSVSRSDALNAAGSLVSKIKAIIDFDPSHSEVYNAALEELENGIRIKFDSVRPELTHHYIGDYTTYRCPEYSACLRLVSDRTYRCEDLNGENLKGYWISDGSLSVNTQGDEYFNIFPVWDWNRVPGVTALQTSSIPRNAGYTHVGQSGFTGGVSDGRRGVSVYEMRNTEDGINLSANKSWFFEGDAIVCIGTNIKSSMNEEIVTTVNQCRKSGPVYTETDGNSRIVRVWHDNTGYVIEPEQGNTENEILLTEEQRSGLWSDINTTQTGSVTETVFELGLSHGEDLSSGGKASYSYYIIPGIDRDEFGNFDESSIRIVSMEESVHAVRNEISGSLHAAFFEEGTLVWDGLTLTVDKPCLLILNDDNTGFISCPSTRQPTSLTVTVIRNDTEKKCVIDISSDGDYAGITHGFSL